VVFDTIVREDPREIGELWIAQIVGRDRSRSDLLLDQRIKPILEVG
jgi:hypothetical protein